MLYTLGIVFGCFFGALLYFRIGRFIGEKKWELGRRFRRSKETFFLFPVSYALDFEDWCWRGEYRRDGNGTECFVLDDDSRGMLATTTISKLTSIWLHALLWPLSIAWNILCLCGIAVYFLVHFCVFGRWRRLKVEPRPKEVVVSEKLRISDELQNTDFVEAKTMALEALREKRDKTEEAIALLEAELELEEDLKDAPRTELHATRH